MTSAFGVEERQRSRLAEQRRAKHRARIAKWGGGKDYRKKMRVVRPGPNTAENRKQLAHHTAVGAGVGASIGASAGAHVGAVAHTHELKQAVEIGDRVGTRGKYAVLGATAGALLGAGYGASAGANVARIKRHKRAVSKSTRTHEAADTTVGAAAAQGTYQGSGYGTKHYVDSRTRKGGRGVTSAQVNRQDKVLKPNKSKYGMRLPKGDPGRDNAGYHRAYPKELPHAGKIRVLGHTHEGKLGVAIGATTTAAGAGAGLLIARHNVRKSEPLAIAGKLWRKPTVVSELRRGFSGTVKGNREVGHAKTIPKVSTVRDHYGYPKRMRTGHSMEGDARQALKAATAHAAEYSPHRTSFHAGVKAGHAATAVATHPEYAISVPSAGAGVGLVHHEVKRSKAKKAKVTKPTGGTMSKSAFGVGIDKADTRSGGAAKGAVGGAVASLAGIQGAGHLVAHQAANATSDSYRAASGAAKVARHARAAPKAAVRLAGSREGAVVAGTGAAFGAAIGALKHKNKTAVAKSAFGIVHKLDPAIVAQGADNTVDAARSVKRAKTSATTGVTTGLIKPMAGTLKSQGAGLAAVTAPSASLTAVGETQGGM